MTETFTTAEFEAALPTHKATGKALWTAVGLVDGEYAYTIPVNANVSIMVRSSVKGDGLAAETGKDSIRCWLVDPETNAPMGSKVSRWTARTKNWRPNMTTVLRELWTMAQKCTTCSCGGTLKIFKVKKDGPNKGRLFTKCSCGKFEWVS